MVKDVNNKQEAGYVTQIDNIIIINPNDLNLKKTYDRLWFNEIYFEGQ